MLGSTITKLVSADAVWMPPCVLSGLTYSSASLNAICCHDAPEQGGANKLF